MTDASGSYFGWTPRLSAAARRADAARQIKEAALRGTPMSPVAITGRKIAHTFWGKSWCDNLERYRDFAHRLERGRSYLRSGSVLDLTIGAGKIAAKVSGSSLYNVAIEIDAVKPDTWRAIQRDCAGNIGSVVELLGGKLSEPVMVRLCADRTGLFPHPSAIRFTCSCPDYALMCKHVAAAMYGVGARLDQSPELLFSLRRVSADDLLASAFTELPAARPASARVLAADGLAAMFGIELAGAPERSKAAEPAAGAPAETPRAGGVTAARGKAKAKPAASAGSTAKPAAAAGATSKPAATAGSTATAKPAATVRSKATSNPAATVRSKAKLTAIVRTKAKPAAKRKAARAKAAPSRARAGRR